MPIEIKELVIRAVLGGADADPAAAEHPAARGGAPAGPDAAATEQSVQECVRQVLRILARQQER